MGFQIPVTPPRYWRHEGQQDGSQCLLCVLRDFSSSDLAYCLQSLATCSPVQCIVTETDAYIPKCPQMQLKLTGLLIFQYLPGILCPHFSTTHILAALEIPGGFFNAPWHLISQSYWVNESYIWTWASTVLNTCQVQPVEVMSDLMESYQELNWRALHDKHESLWEHDIAGSLPLFLKEKAKWFSESIVQGTKNVAPLHCLTIKGLKKPDHWPAALDQDQE